MFKLLIFLFSFVYLTNSNSIEYVKLYQYFNSQKHNTIRYDSVNSNYTSDLILRRGDVAFLAVQLREPANLKNLQFIITMMFGYQPLEQDGSLLTVPITSSPSGNNSWSATIHSIKNKQVDFKLYIPPNAPVGGWRMNWQLSENGQITSESFVENTIYILFNPWLNADSVFMPDRTDIEEYVLNDFGVFYSGSIYNPEGREWYYDQFKKESLQTAVYLLDRIGLSTEERKNPIIVTRALSQMVNSNDDNGILFGKWEAPYTPDKAPWEWLGSGQILEQYVRTGGAPVKYAQCWVFAGVTTTLCRTLGIPSRTITNFASAHDTDASLTVDRFFTPDGNEVKGVNSDSIWNFHVWSEVWITRPDLPNRFSKRNWQVIDATPQEKSNNIFRMGPANIQATKLGEVNLNYDMPFLYSEVNSDQISWVKDYQTGRWRKINVDTRTIGQLILTKSKSSGVDYTPQILTNEYKFREGSNEERESIMRAGKIMNIKYVYDPSVSLRARKGDVKFEFTTETKQEIGKDMLIKYTITNKVNTERTVKKKITVKSVYYSGKDGNDIKIQDETIVLKPKESREFFIVIPVKDYLNKGVEFSNYKVSAFLTVVEKPQNIAEEIIVVMSKPKLHVSLTGTQKIGSKLTVAISFKNPLTSTNLTNCKLKSKETAITEEMEKALKNIGPNEKISFSFVTVAKKEGKSVLVLQLDCKEVFDIRGRVAFNVLEK